MAHPSAMRLKTLSGDAASRQFGKASSQSVVLECYRCICYRILQALTNKRWVQEDDGIIERRPDIPFSLDLDGRRKNGEPRFSGKRTVDGTSVDCRSEALGALSEPEQRSGITRQRLQSHGGGMGHSGIGLKLSLNRALCLR